MAFRKPFLVPDNVTEISEARRITTPVRRIAPEVLQEFGVTRLSQLAGHVEDARRELLEGMKLVDNTEERELHIWLGQLINSIDDLRQRLATQEES